MTPAPLSPTIPRTAGSGAETETRRTTTPRAAPAIPRTLARILAVLLLLAPIGCGDDGATDASARPGDTAFLDAGTGDISTTDDATDAGAPGPDARPPTDAGTPDAPDHHDATSSADAPDHHDTRPDDTLDARPDPDPRDAAPEAGGAPPRLAFDWIDLRAAGDAADLPHLVRGDGADSLAPDLARIDDPHVATIDGHRVVARALGQTVAHVSWGERTHAVHVRVGPSRLAIAGTPARFVGTTAGPDDRPDDGADDDGANDDGANDNGADDDDRTDAFHDTPITGDTPGAWDVSGTPIALRGAGALGWATFDRGDDGVDLAWFDTTTTTWIGRVTLPAGTPPVVLPRTGDTAWVVRGGADPLPLRLPTPTLGDPPIPTFGDPLALPSVAGIGAVVVAPGESGTLHGPLLLLAVRPAGDARGTTAILARNLDTGAWVDLDRATQAVDATHLDDPCPGDLWLHAAGDVLLVGCAGERGGAATLHPIDLRTLRPRDPLTVSTARVDAWRATPDGRHVVLVGEDGGVGLVAVAPLALLRDPAEGPGIGSDASPVAAASIAVDDTDGLLVANRAGDRLGALSDVRDLATIEAIPTVRTLRSGDALHPVRALLAVAGIRPPLALDEDHVHIAEPAWAGDGFANPRNLLGEPEGGTWVTPNADPDGVVTIPEESYIELRLHGAVLVDGPGDDLVVAENAFLVGGSWASRWVEPATLAVSADGVTWVPFPVVEDPTRSDWRRWVRGFVGIVPVAGGSRSGISFRDPSAGGDRFDLADAGIDEVRAIRIIDVPGHGTADIDGLVLLNWRAE